MREKERKHVSAFVCMIECILYACANQSRTPKCWLITNTIFLPLFRSRIIIAWFYILSKYHEAILTLNTRYPSNVKGNMRYLLHYISLIAVWGDTITTKHDFMTKQRKVTESVVGCQDKIGLAV